MWTMYIFFENHISFSDNVFSIKSWIKNKFQFEESVIDKQFGIPDDFDYIEWRWTVCIYVSFSSVWYVNLILTYMYLNVQPMQNFMYILFYLTWLV